MDPADVKGDDVGADDRSGSEAHPILDHRVGADVDVVGKLGTTGDDGSGVTLVVAHRSVGRTVSVGRS